MGTYFGDKTVQQELLSETESLMVEHNLSKEDMGIILLSVAQAVLDPFEHRLNEIREEDKKKNIWIPRWIT
jgi:hypothetical protein